MLNGKIPQVAKTTYEENYPILEALVDRIKHKWTLKALPSIDFDDIKNIILFHIYKKWNLYDSARPVEGWASTIIHHQFVNLLRNYYTSTSRPCNKCAASVDINDCSIYQEQCVKCPLYRKWTETKSEAHNIRLPVSVENHQSEIYERPDDSFNFETSAKFLHKRMRAVLKPNEWRIYSFLYIENLNEEDVAKIMGYKTSEKNRISGYKRIRQLKISFMEKAKKILQENGIESF